MAEHVDKNECCCVSLNLGRLVIDMLTMIIDSGTMTSVECVKYILRHAVKIKIRIKKVDLVP